MQTIFCGHHFLLPIDYHSLTRSPLAAPLSLCLTYRQTDTHTHTPTLSFFLWAGVLFCCEYLGQDVWRGPMAFYFFVRNVFPFSQLPNMSVWESVATHLHQQFLAKLWAIPFSGELELHPTSQPSCKILNLTEWYIML